MSMLQKYQSVLQNSRCDHNESLEIVNDVEKVFRYLHPSVYAEPTIEDYQYLSTVELAKKTGEIAYSLDRLAHVQALNFYYQFQFQCKMAIDERIDELHDKVFNGMQKVLSCLLECSQKQLVIDSSTFDAIAFKPYSFDALYNDMNEYYNSILDKKLSQEEIVTIRESIKTHVPDTLMGHFDKIFKLKLPFYWSYVGNKYIDANYFLERCSYEDASRDGVFYVDVISNDQLLEIDSSLGTDQKYVNTAELAFEDAKEYISNEEFQRNFSESYIKYLRSVCFVIENALVKIQSQIQFAENEKATRMLLEQERHDSEMRRSIILNPNDFSDEEIMKYIKRRRL